MDSDEFRFDIGVAQPSCDLKLDNCTAVANACATHYTVHSIKAELDQICYGLNTMGVLQFIRDNAVLMDDYFKYLSSRHCVTVYFTR